MPAADRPQAPGRPPLPPAGSAAPAQGDPPAPGASAASCPAGRPDFQGQLAAVLAARGIPHRLQGQKLLMPAVWHGKTRLTVAVWPGGGWNNAAVAGEHGTWRELLARLGVEDSDDHQALAEAAAQLDHAALARGEQSERARRQRQAHALYQRAQTLHHAPSAVLSGSGQAAVRDRRRKAGHRQRLGPALRYLEQRGLSAALIDALCTLDQPRRHAETIVRYLDEGEHGGILVFPIQRGTAFSPVQLLGVQRIYLDPQGHKRPGPGPDGAPKQMLGAATYRLAESAEPCAGACWLHRDARPGGTVILCEGTETGLGCWDASDLQAIVGILFSASGLAQVDAEQVKRLHPAQVIIAADHDASGTGQRAARRCAWRLHRAGVGNIAIATPPRALHGVPIGTAKGADWLDVLAAAGRAAAGRGFKDCTVPYVPSSLDAGLPLAPSNPADPDRPRAPVLPLYRLRAVPTAPAPPQRLPLAQAQAANAALIHAALQTPQGITLVAGQAGLGKTYAIRQALADPQTPPALVLAPTTALATELVRDFPGSDLVQYLGRSPDPASPGHCLRFARIEDLRANRRSIMAHECQSCPHGLAASRRPGSQDRLLSALNGELYQGRLDLNDPAVRRDLRREAAAVQPCPWIQHRERLPLAPHVAASHAAYAQDHAKVLDQTGPDLPRRQVVIDEAPPLFEETAVTLQTLTQWLAKNTADAPYPPDGMAAADWAVLNGRLDTALRTLARLLGQHPEARNHRISAADLDLRPLVQTLEAFPRALDGLRPEAVIRDRQGERCLVPLRALEDLKRAVELGTAWIHAGLLLITVPTRYGEEMSRRARPFLMTDATPRRLARALADTCHPLVVDTPRQTLHLHLGRLHGKGSAEDPRELEDLIQVLEEAVEHQGSGQVCALTHKPLARQVIAQIAQSRVRGWRPEDARYIGWFGRHDRGQNDWQGLKVLIQWGVHRLAPAAMQRRYEAERALAAQAGLAWQPWSDERTEQWFALPYRAADGSGLEIAARLPVNPDQAAWERDLITASVVQGNGRLRALQRPGEPLEIHLYTHYPLDGHGLWIDQVHAPGPRAGGQRSRDQWRHELREDSRLRFRLAREAGAHSRRAINRFLADLGLPTLSNTTYQHLLAEAGQAVPQACATRDEALEEALERVLGFIMAGPVPVHIDELAALVLEYAACADRLIDRLAGTLLAYALLAPAGTPASWTATPSDPNADIPPRPD